MKVIYREKEWVLQGRKRVREAIEEVGLVPHTVLAVREGKLLTEDSLLSEDDVLRLVAVISGG